MPTTENTSPARVTLPTGGRLQGLSDISFQSTGCSAVTNLQTQIAPLLASMACQFGILRLLKPLIEIVKELPSPSPRAIQEFAKAATALEPCLLSPAPAVVTPFIRDLLCLQIKSLNCFLKNLDAAEALAAHDPGGRTTEAIQTVLASFQPINGILDLAGELFQISGMQLPQVPTLVAGTDASSLSADKNVVTEYTAKLQVLIDALGGC